MPLDGEPVVGKTANSAFIGAALEGMLDELGATTLVMCGVLTSNSVETMARAMPAISAIRPSSSPTPHGRSTRSISAAGAGRPKMSTRCRSRICTANTQLSSIPR